jgi:hypothetical protein
VSDLNPFKPAEEDARRLLEGVWNRVVDFRKTYVTALALKMLGVTALAVAVAILNFPFFAVALVACVLVAQAIYNFYATKLLKDKDRELRWAWIAGKRVEQRSLEARISDLSATLAILGLHEVGGRLNTASPELRSALAFSQRRLQLAEERAEDAEASRDGLATDDQARRVKAYRRDRAPRAPKRPDVNPIKARRAALEAEHSTLEAEIKSLATAEDVDSAMRAEEVQGARRTERERRDAARRADQAARDRVRAGRTATAPEPEHVVTVEFAANGRRSVGSGRGGATPEQIAKGEDEAA